MKYQWHVFLASLDPTHGSEQAGRRPVLVISRERVNQLLPVVNIMSSHCRAVFTPVTNWLVPSITRSQ